MSRLGGNKVIFADSVVPRFGVPWIDLEAEKPRLEAMMEDQVAQFMEKWAELERLRGLDPTEYGWKLQSWDEVIDLWTQYVVHCICGGNRSTKSSLAARIVVKLAELIPEAEIRCWHVNEDRSIEDQQRFIWEALPARHKELAKKRGRNFSINYSQSNGFTNSTCILPPQQGAKRGSTIKFQNYRQYQQDPQVAEGFKAHLVWMDEEAPQKLLDTMLYRLIDFKGRLLLTFTTLKGWTPLLADILGKYETLKTRHSDLVNRNLPVLQRSLSRKGAVIHYFWTQDNPFVPHEDFLKSIASRPMAERLARAHGIPQKSAATPFPKFSREVNVKPAKDMPWAREGGQGDKYPRTLYMCVDGAGARNWFMIWVAVDAAGTWWVYREWPDVKSVGEWAEPGTNPGGHRGIAQQSLGYGTQAYVDLIKKAEGSEELFGRYLDPRFAATEKQLKDGVTTPQQELADLGLDFIAAPGVNEDAGIQEINTLLEYDDERPMDAANSPKLYISEDCENLIFAMCEYTASQGKDEPTKDPVDTLRYLATARIEYMDTSRRVVRRTTGGY